MNDDDNIFTHFRTLGIEKTLIIKNVNDEISKLNSELDVCSGLLLNEDKCYQVYVQLKLITEMIEKFDKMLEIDDRLGSTDKENHMNNFNEILRKTTKINMVCEYLNATYRNENFENRNIYSMKDYFKSNLVDLSNDINDIQLYRRYNVLLNKLNSYNKILNSIR